MARTVEDIVKIQIGNLVLQIAQLTSENEALKEQLLAELNKKEQKNVRTE